MKHAEMIRIKHTTLPWGYPNINMLNRRVQLFFCYNKNNTVKHTSQTVNLDFQDCIFRTNIQKKKGWRQVFPNYSEHNSFFTSSSLTPQEIIKLNLGIPQHQNYYPFSPPSAAKLQTTK